MEKYRTMTQKIFDTSTPVPTIAPLPAPAIDEAYEEPVRISPKQSQASPKQSHASPKQSHTSPKQSLTPISTKSSQIVEYLPTKPTIYDSIESKLSYLEMLYKQLPVIKDTKMGYSKMGWHTLSKSRLSVHLMRLKKHIDNVIKEKDKIKEKILEIDKILHKLSSEVNRVQKNHYGFLERNHRPPVFTEPNRLHKIQEDVLQHMVNHESLWELLPTRSDKQRHRILFDILIRNARRYQREWNNKIVSEGGINHRVYLRDSSDISKTEFRKYDESLIELSTQKRKIEVERNTLTRSFIKVHSELKILESFFDTLFNEIVTEYNMIKFPSIIST